MAKPVPPQRAKRKAPAVAKRAPAPPPAIDRAALLTALREKAKALGACPIPPGQSPEIAARLRIEPNGKIDRVEWRGARLSAELDRCYRQEILRWQLPNVKLSRAVTVLVSLELNAR